MIRVYHLSHIDRNDWRYDAIHFPRIAEAPPENADVKDEKDVTALAVATLAVDGFYEHAADVVNASTNGDVEIDMEAAFVLTNTINHPWYENSPSVVTPMNTSKRSTSVGDVMVTDKGVFVVAAIGFQQVKISEHAFVPMKEPMK